MSDLQNHTLEETAGILRCFPSYLEENLHRFPHQKIGKAVAFDDDEIRAIKDLHRVHATPVAADVAAVATPTEAPAPRVSNLRPSQKNRRRTG